MARQELPPGFGPARTGGVTPAHHDAVLDRLTNPSLHVSPRDAAPIDGERIDNMGVVEVRSQTQDLSTVLAHLSEMQLHNGPRDEQGKPRKPLTIAQMPELAALVHEAFYSPNGPGPAMVLLPAHYESETVEMAINNGARELGGPNTLCMVTGADKDTVAKAKAAAERTGSRVIEQAQILQAIDWRGLRIALNIRDYPEGAEVPNTPIRGSKGLTVIAGIIAIEGLRELGQTQPNPIVMFHDTDVITPEIYGGIPLTLAPFLRNPGLIMSMIAKDGSGRNNHPIQTAASMLMSTLTRSQQVIEMGAFLGVMMWPLTGERAFPLDVALDMPLPVSMGLEIATDLYIAGREAVYEGSVPLVAQVANPADKVENRPSTEAREYKMITGLAVYTRAYEDVVSRTGRFPHEWTVDDVREFNHALVMQRPMVVIPSTGLEGTKIEQMPPDYMLPSVRQMIDMGIINMEQVKTVLQGSN